MTSRISVLTFGLMALMNGVAALGPAPVNLGTAANYAVLAASGVTVVPPSSITGDVGLSSASALFLTGFASTLDKSGTFSTSPQVVGKIFAASYTTPTPATLAAAVLSMGAAHTDAAGRVNPGFNNLASGLIGGLTLVPGLYKWTTNVLVPTSVTIAGSATDTWIFQIAGTFNVASGQQVILTGGALAKNIVWVVEGAVALQAGAVVQGTILAKTGATLVTGSTVHGHVLAQTLVALQKATVIVPT